MTYTETIEYLFGKLPMYQRQGAPAFKKTLRNINLLTEHDNMPQKNYPIIHIGGTNGKGSVSHIIASVLQEAGYKTGLYTSPHLQDFRERIKINGTMISEEEVIQYIEANKIFFEEINPSFFEMTVALAFHYFSEQKVDIALIEVGLGGRLDSTNIVKPIMSLITNISFDHTQFLGNSLPEIAKEKAGIIKEKTPIIISEYQKEVAEVFIETAAMLDAPIYFADKTYHCLTELSEDSATQVISCTKNGQKVYPGLKTDLIGKYQKHNIAASLSALDILKEKYNIPDNAIYSGIASVCRNTDFKGRWQILGKNPTIIADTGHNIAGLKENLAQLEKTKYKTLHFIFGTVKDKNIKSVLEILPENAVYYFTKAQIPRAADETFLFNLAQKKGLKGKKYETTKAAYNAAIKNADKEDLIFIGGSTFIVAELL